jgi:hypothetical protein
MEGINLLKLAFRVKLTTWTEETIKTIEKCCRKNIVI